MILAEFDYHAPTTLDEALSLLDQFGDEAKLLAGGHSLIPRSNCACLPLVT